MDPEQRGRLMLTVPDVLGDDSLELGRAVRPAWPDRPVHRWAFILVPPIGAGVWAEFEHGDPNRPIWSGCRWGSQSDMPTAAALGNPADPELVMQSLLQHSLRDQRHAADAGHWRHHSEEHHRRDDHRQRQRHLHPQRQRARRSN